MTTAKIKCDISKLPKPSLLKQSPPNGKKLLKQSLPNGKKRDWSLVNRGANNGKMGRPRFYTPAQDAVIKQLKAEGKSFKEIGDQLGRSGEAIRRRWYAIR